MKSIVALSLMGLLAVAYAAGPNMSDGSEKECEVAFKCYDKCGHGDDDGNGLEHRICFFECLGKRDQDTVSRDFRQDVKEVYKWCKNEQRDSDAPDSKVLKCTLKKVKKDACRWYFRSQKD